MPHRNVPYPSPTKQSPLLPRNVSNGSPSRPLESQLDVLYNIAVQAFVRRDHIKTQENLSRLLQLLKGQKSGKKTWYDIHDQPNGHVNGSSSGDPNSDEWTIKTLKLLVTSHASLYTDPPNSASLSPETLALLPPSPPDKLLAHIYQTCLEHFDPLLPPQLISTFILASLKLRPSETALSWTHHLVEDWLANLPDSLMTTISSHKKIRDPTRRKQIEGLREAYLKVVELFVGEVLAREGEWEMARGLLDGEGVMSSKRKEELYRHLRAMQARKSNPSSPSNSGILPSPSASPSSSGILPRPESPSPRRKGRSLSTSSSSSERTARPVNTGVDKLATRTTPPGHVDRKGKGRAVSTTASTESVPRHIEVNHTPAKSTPSTVDKMSKSLQKWLDGTLDLLPPALRTRVRSISLLRILGISTGLPLIILALILSLRRRRRTHTAGATVAGAAAVRGGIQDVRTRLALARQRGLFHWLRYWLGWWVEKFIGVWNLGTSITYF